jgi:uncharacterized membrane protein YoaK (UPF0700 family)
MARCARPSGPGRATRSALLVAPCGIILAASLSQVARTMLIRQGEARSSGADRSLAWSLAGIAGSVNAAGFYAAGLYSSHMTGTISTMADRLARGELGAAALSLTIVACFVSGATVSTLLINEGQRRQLAQIYALSIFAEAALLAVLGCLDLWLPHDVRGPALVIGLSFLMGLQNAIVTRISNARIRTTHVTGMVTDIGIELGHLVGAALRRHTLGASTHVEKLKLHLPTVLSFFGGGVLGVLGYKLVGPLLLLGVAAILAAMASPVLFLARVKRRGLTT